MFTQFRVSYGGIGRRAIVLIVVIVLFPASLWWCFVNKAVWTKVILRLGIPESKHEMPTLQHEFSTIAQTDPLFSSVTFKDANCHTYHNSLPWKWCLGNDGSLHFVNGSVREGSSEFIHFFWTRRGAEKCLAQKRVILVGDSRVRYQYMFLAAFLRWGSWARCQDQIPYANFSSLDKDACFLIDHSSIEKKTKSWSEWYSASNSLLHDGVPNSSSSFQSELCFCNRPEPFRAHLHEGVENRFLLRSSPFGRISISYFQSLQNEVVRINDSIAPRSQFSGLQLDRIRNQTCAPWNCRIAFSDMVAKGDKEILELVSRLNPTDVFFNAGWFDDSRTYPAWLRKMQRRLKFNLYYISHPAILGDKRAYPLTDSDALDLRTISLGVPRKWYWDKNHALSILNRAYNDRLLQLLCGSPNSTVA